MREEEEKKEAPSWLQLAAEPVFTPRFHKEAVRQGSELNLGLGLPEGEGPEVGRIWGHSPGEEGKRTGELLRADLGLPLSALALCLHPRCSRSAEGFPEVRVDRAVHVRMSNTRDAP